MTVLSVVQGLVETEDGKVFEFDSFKASVWLESVISFRFEPTNSNKPYTVRKEVRPGGDYWYGYRKVAGVLHKKYIGKTPELKVQRLEEIAEALNIPPQSRVKNKVTHTVNTLVTHDVEDIEADKLTALEHQVQSLQLSFEALRGELLGKPQSLSKDDIKSLRQEVEELRQWKTNSLKVFDDFNNLQDTYQKCRKHSLQVEQDLDRAVERFVRAEAALKVTQAENERLLIDLGNLQAEKEDLAQLKKQAKEHAHELHREENAMKLEKDRWQRELSDARADLADAKATILKQADRIRELERGFSLQPNPAESRLRLEIGELQEQLSDLKQKSTPTSEIDAADLLNQLKAKRRKSTASLADIEAILGILEGVNP